MTRQEIPNFIRMERDPWAPGKSLLALHYLNHGCCKVVLRLKSFSACKYSTTSVTKILPVKSLLL